MSRLMYIIHYTGIHQFLTTSAPDLQMVFDSACGFGMFTQYYCIMLRIWWKGLQISDQKQDYCVK